MKHTLESTLANLNENKAYAKQVFYGLGDNFAVLWFDRKGYSVTTHTEHSHGTTGILSNDAAVAYFVEFIRKVTIEQIAHSEPYKIDKARNCVIYSTRQ